MFLLLLINSAIALDCSSPKYYELCTSKRIFILEKAYQDSLNKEETEECLGKGLAIISSSKKLESSKKYLDRASLALKKKVDHKLIVGFSSEEERDSLLSEAQLLDKKIEWFNSSILKFNKTTSYFDSNCSGKMMADNPSELSIDRKAEFIEGWILE